MKKQWIAVFLCCLFSLMMLSSSNSSTVKADQPEDLLSKVLAEVSLTKEEVRFTDSGIERTYGNDPLRLPFFNQQLKNPLGTPAFLESNALYIANNATSLRNLVWLASLRLGYTVSVFPPYEPELDHRLVKEAPMLYAISEIHTFHQEPLSAQAFRSLRDALKDIPLEIQAEIAKILYASLFFKECREKAFSSFSEAELMTVFRNPAKTLMHSYDPLSHRMLMEANFGLLYYGAVQLVKTLDASLKAMEELGYPSDWDFDWITPMGSILLKGAEDHVHTRREVLLSIDSGGNNTYLASPGATASYFNPVSITIDVEGNDTYLQTEHDVYAQGAGVLGIGILIDLEGDDTYEAEQMAQGFGCFGIGILVDAQGNDHYISRYLAQGAGVYGIGYLIDHEGDDQYDTFTFAQGFGYVKGFGCLLDLKGNDIYIANNEEVDGSNPQSSDHNTSMAQGAGFGRRADLSDGNSMSGGFGLLIDMEGDDYYSCGVFGQGTGYWAGTGLLYDAEGNDQFKGVWYVQGASAHFAIGALINKKGDDRYDALLNMAQGAGHDFSLGFLIDEEGDDHYIAPNLALGAGNDNGIGFFVDGGGNDIYETRSPGRFNLGKANYSRHLWGSWRDQDLTLGIFIDRGGQDQYPEDRGRNNDRWNFHQEGAPMSRGAGIDAEHGTVPGFLTP